MTPQSTAEEDGEYSITIDYIDQGTGDKVTPSWQGLAKTGETWSHESPAISGYALVDSAQATMSGTVSGNSHFLTFTVAYKALTISYTVIHMKQLNTGTYYEAETETFTGIAGSTVTVVPKSYAGYKCVTTDLSLAVAADGGSVKRVYYDQDPMNYAVYFSTKGSYIAPITGAPGSTIVAPADPTRTGYTFAGWDIDGDGKADEVPTTMPAHNVFATALWIPATVNYVINYYMQNFDGSYSLSGTATATGTTDSTTPAAPAQDVSKTGAYAWYEYSHEDSVPIKADGSSVLNVYYDRVNITFITEVMIDDKTPVVYENKTVRYGYSEPFPDQAAINQLYKDNGGTAPNFNGWWSDSGGAWRTGALGTTGTDSDFDTKTATWKAYFTTNTLYTYYFNTYRPDLEGAYPTTASSAYAWTTKYTGVSWTQGAGTGFTHALIRYATGTYDGTNYDTLVWTDWIAISGSKYTAGVDGTHGITPTSNMVEFRPARNTYYAHYYSGGAEVGNVGHLYQAPYSTSEVDGTALTPPTEGYLFKGWYATSDFSGSPTTDAKMSSVDAVYYAKWEPKPVTVTFNSDGGTAVDTQTVGKGSTATEPVAPTKASGAQFLGWYYYDNGAPVRFDFDQSVEGDIKLVALWNPPHDLVAYTVVHMAADGTVLANETGSGEETSTLTAQALPATDARRAGYAYADAEAKSIVLGSDTTKNVVTFTYSNDPIHSYTVHYVDRATGAKIADDLTFTSDKNLVDLTAKDIPGYTVEDDTGWVASSNATPVASEDSTDLTSYTFYYNANPVSDTEAVSAVQETPKTGDATPVGALILCLLASCLAVGFCHRRIDGLR